MYAKVRADPIKEGKMQAKKAVSGRNYGSALHARQFYLFSWQQLPKPYLENTVSFQRV